MTLNEFRLAHSTVIEHYQFIEFQLRGIYAMLSGTDFLVGLQDVEKHNLFRIIKAVQEQEKSKNIIIITDLEYEELKSISRRRNFWAHSCYTDLVFDAKTNGLKKIKDIQQLHSDIREAEEMRERLYEIKMKLFKENQNKN